MLVFVDLRRFETESDIEVSFGIDIEVEPCGVCIHARHAESFGIVIVAKGSRSGASLAEKDRCAHMSDAKQQSLPAKAAAGCKV